MAAADTSTSPEIPRPLPRILTQEDLDFFRETPTYETVLQFVLDLRDAATGRVNSFACEQSPAATSTLLLLDEIEVITKTHPPVPNEKSRFGNPAFRDFFDDLERTLPDMLTKHYPLCFDGSHAKMVALVEVSTYLLNAFGNRTRIDYGSGHELNFICFLLCLRDLGVVSTPDDMPALVLRVFNRYIALMRIIQSEYWLEPAGSHGVWGLDDYHFLPFLFGAAQLATHKHLRPRSIHDADVLEMFAKDYMYLAAVQFINSVKTASLRWSSPMLDDISGVKTWAKVSEGMVKMYKNEVLGKVPIMQHFLFGTLLPVDTLPSERDGGREGVMQEELGAEPSEHAGHIHVDGAWSDCCGIKIPSSIAAAQMSQTGALRSVPVRPVPFD
ncbi:uncharacterized protein V1518DRAFT_374992 [Limtongia smithiae]|uniref:uncharacterized protein n=1 Tax=Limtongia smithiae TaxID=1125753 RepID=UPI0034CFF4EA